MNRDQSRIIDEYDVDDLRQKFEDAALKHCEKYDVMVTEAYEKMKAVKDISAQYLNRNKRFMTEQLIKEFTNDFEESLLILKREHELNTQSLLKRIKEEGHRSCTDALQSFLENLNRIREKKKEEELDKIKEEIERQRNAAKANLESAIRKEMSQVKVAQLQELEESLKAEKVCMQHKIQEELDQSIQNALDRETSAMKTALSKCEIQMRREASERLEAIRQEGKHTTSKQVAALRSKLAKQFDEQEKTLRQEKHDEWLALKEKEENKIRNRAKAREKRLIGEIRDDHTRYLAKFAEELENSVHLQVEQAIRKFRKTVDSERAEACKRIRADVEAERIKRLEITKKELDEHKTAESAKYMQQLQKEHEMELLTLKITTDKEVQEECNRIRAEFSENKSKWMLAIRSDAEKDRNQAMLSLRRELEHDRKLIVAKITDEIITQREKGLRVEQSNHDLEMQNILKPYYSRQAASPTTTKHLDEFNNPNDIVSRVATLSSRVVQLQQADRDKSRYSFSTTKAAIDT